MFPSPYFKIITLHQKIPLGSTLFLFFSGFFAGFSFCFSPFPSNLFLLLLYSSTSALPSTNFSLCASSDKYSSIHCLIFFHWVTFHLNRQAICKQHLGSIYTVNNQHWKNTNNTTTGVLTMYYATFMQHAYTDMTAF